MKIQIVLTGGKLCAQYDQIICISSYYQCYNCISYMIRSMLLVNSICVCFK